MNITYPNIRGSKNNLEIRTNKGSDLRNRTDGSESDWLGRGPDQFSAFRWPAIALKKLRGNNWVYSHVNLARICPNVSELFRNLCTLLALFGCFESTKSVISHLRRPNFIQLLSKNCGATTNSILA